MKVVGQDEIRRSVSLPAAIASMREAVIAHLHGVKGLRRLHREEGSDGVRRAELLDVSAQREVGESVAVVGEEHLVVGHVGGDGSESLTDRSVDPCVDERHLPVHDLAEILDPFPTLWLTRTSA